MTSYDAGALWAFQTYMERVDDTFEPADITGYLSGSRDQSDHSKGALHGFALAAELHHRMMGICTGRIPL